MHEFDPEIWQCMQLTAKEEDVIFIILNVQDMNLTPLGQNAVVADYLQPVRGLCREWRIGTLILWARHQLTPTTARHPRQRRFTPRFVSNVVEK
jgi:hypothetical protein